MDRVQRVRKELDMTSFIFTHLLLNRRGMATPLQRSACENPMDRFGVPAVPWGHSIDTTAVARLISSNERISLGNRNHANGLEVFLP